jgi:hypothetical protein
MSKNTEQKNVKMNLSINKDFFDLLQEQADRDYMRVSTWTKWFLKKSLLGNNKNSKQLQTNEHAV